MPNFNQLSVVGNLSNRTRQAYNCGEGNAFVA